MRRKILYPMILIAVVLSVMLSCKKDVTAVTTKTTTTTKVTASASNGTIALATVDTSSTGKKDTLFLINCFPPHNPPPDSVAFSALPSAIGTYLTANYSGYTFEKSFKTDSAKTLTGYIVVIKYNGNFVGLRFNASGTFVSVLEQMLGQDMQNPQGCHPGGPFPDRQGGPGRDTIAISAVPSAVLTYFHTTYPTDTLLQASLTPDTTYLLISKNGALYATNITAAGKLISRDKIEPGPINPKPVQASALLSAITTYLTTTYPGYVVDKAFADMQGSTVAGYDVFITVNKSNYVVHFDSSGKFVKATTIH